MAAINIDLIFDAAIRIQLLEEKSVSISFTEDEVRIKFPTTRRLAEFLDVPHYYVLPYFAMMEEQGLVTRAERVGVMTSASGTKKFVSTMAAGYRETAEKILGPAIFRDLRERVP